MRKVAVLFLPALAALAVACGSSSTTTAGSSTTTSGAPTTVASSTGSGGSTGTSAAIKKVSANNASEAQLKAALTAAGVSNAAKWTDEIMEYRPYDTSDPSLSKLKQELAKYKPDQATLQKILSVLEP